MTKSLACIFLLVCWTSAAIAGLTADSKQVAAVENVYADLNDASSVIATFDSGFVSSYRGKDRVAWEQVYREKRREFSERMAKLPSQGLSENDTKALAAMRTQFAALSETVKTPLSAEGKCADASRKNADYAALHQALLVCFTENANNLAFEGAKINRPTALSLLHQIEQPERRKAVFMALSPLWRSVNGNDEADSPYRRLIAMAAAGGGKRGSEIDAAARDAGVNPAEVERWLEQILDAWRLASPDQSIEPWNFSYLCAEADRSLSAAIPHESLLPVNKRFYRDLGADLEQLGTLWDLDPRPGKAPLSYSDIVIHGRMVHGAWQPTIARVSASYSQGGLSTLNELVHENGHVVNFTAIRNRPAYMDWPGDLLGEAFADVPSWSTYEPAWQRRYLGRETSDQVSLRALYSSVMLDVAWALFEVRMLRAPGTDPNLLWSDITSHYLHIVPHPELSWWALREQLVDIPGYMVNYGLGAVLTADMRQHIREALGPFDTGDLRWYPWLGEHLLRYGSERDSRTLLQDFLGRPVSPQALLDQIHRLRPPH